jgi:hypothetical protein
LLVIDASIAHAAGDVSMDPTSIERDRPLIEAALVTEKRIALLHDKVRRHLQENRTNLYEVRAIRWVNPTNPTEEVMTWLNTGAHADTRRKLGHVPTETSR